MDKDRLSLKHPDFNNLILKVPIIHQLSNTTDLAQIKVDQAKSTLKLS